MCGSPTVARPLLYILEIIQNTIPHIFHANKFSLTVLPSCMFGNFDHSCRLYTILCLKFVYSVCINHHGLYFSNRTCRLIVFSFSSVWMLEPAGHDKTLGKKLTQRKVFCEALTTFLYIKHTFTRSLVHFAFPWVLHLSDLFALFHVLLPHPYHFHIAHVVFCFRPFRNLTLSTFSS